jgi:putative ABC transport system permease protein
VNLVTVAAKNLTRNRGRTILTVLAVAFAIVFFILFRTMIWSWTAASEQGASDRIGIRHKVTFIMTMPKRYIEEVRTVPGVTAAAYANWFGGKDPKHEREFFGSIAVDPTDMLNVFDELKVKPAEVESWKQNRKGALVGDAIARKLGWKVGDRVTLRGTIYPGDWEFVISGIYTATKASVDRSTFYFHWNYLNDSPVNRRKDQIGWIAARIDNAGKSGQVCRAIDAKFDERDIQTLCMSERAMQASFLGMLSAILKAIDIVSIVILLIMGLILGNTIAMGVRERTTEYGTLRAIGFVPKHIVMFVVGESIFTGLVGGVLGLLIAYPLIDQLIGRSLEENFGAFFPFFRIQPMTALVALGAALGLGALAAVVPAYGTSRLKAVDALRRVG